MTFDKSIVRGRSVGARGRLFFWDLMLTDGNTETSGPLLCEWQRAGIRRRRLVVFEPLASPL